MSLKTSCCIVISLNIRKILTLTIILCDQFSKFKNQKNLQIYKYQYQILIDINIMRAAAQVFSRQNQRQQSQGYNDPNEKSKIFIVKTPFYFNSIDQVRSLISEKVFEKMNQEQQNQICLNVLPSKEQIILQKKKLEKPMQVLKLKPMRHKTTGQRIFKIKQASQVEYCYDYDQLGDFICSKGSAKNQLKLNQESILEQIKQYLHKKVTVKQMTQQSQNTQKYMQLIQPLFFLKPFNLTPPNCDMLSFKTKNAKDNLSIISQNIDFKESVPIEPLTQIPAFIAESFLFKKVKQYLGKRPCWLKNALLYTLYQDGFKEQFSLNDFKNVMRYTCFTYRNGPWKHTFCAFGFDPKKSYKSVIYQSISLKLKQKQIQDFEKQVQELIYDPTFSQISSRCIRSYQLCDIRNQKIKEIISGKLIGQEGQCLKQTGWLSISQQNKIMKIMKQYIKQQNK